MSWRHRRWKRQESSHDTRNGHRRMELRRRRVLDYRGRASRLWHQPDRATARRGEEIGMNATQEMRRRTRRFMIIAFAVAAVAFIVIAWGGIDKNLVYYWTPTDLHAAGDKAYGATIRLGGMVSKGSIKNLTGVSGLEFDVHDAAGIVH